MKHFISLFLLFVIYQLKSQVLQGTIMDLDHEPLIGATVLELNTSNGVVTGLDGRFQLSLTSIANPVVIAYVGYKNDTIVYQTEPLNVFLKPESNELSEVIVQSKSTFIDELQAHQIETITEAELTKAACCNLSESFETNASVDVSFSDAVSGSKTIQLLGLAGRFVQINKESIPFVRGIISNQGLSYLPGTWIQAIDVGKGAGTVVNGFESLTGQINVELKKPEIGEKIYLNGYVNSFGRTELNVNTRKQLNKNWSTALLVHGDYLVNEIDRNEDGFMDLSKGRQFNVLNRYKYTSDRMVSQIGIHFMTDERTGGQTGFNFGDDASTSPLYGFINQTNRIEVFGKLGLLFPHKPYKGWGFIYSYSHVDRNMAFGRGVHVGDHSSGYANVIFQNIIGKNSFHSYKTGVSYRYDSYDELFMNTPILREESAPGAYFEYTYAPKERFSLIAGIRTDLHNLFGTYFTPRLHSRYALTDRTTIRASAGKGYRTPNLIADNARFLFSSRTWNLPVEIQPEVSWNMGGSVSTSVPTNGSDLTIVTDYFYTSFKNQLIVDLDQNVNEVNLYNLEGSSFAHSYQVEIGYPVSEKLSTKAAYKYYDVRTTINGVLREVPYNAKNRFFLNLAYATRFDKWKADVTWVWNGAQRLPDTSSSHEAFQRPSFSPSYSRINSQLSRSYKWGSIYLGSENLLNFVQDHPIIDPENPFGNDFDASFVWGPIVGRMIYAGFRYKLD